MKAAIRKGDLAVIDADGIRHRFGDGKPPHVIMHIHDRQLYRRLVLQTEMAAGEGYMDGTLTFEEGSGVADLIALYHSNRAHLARHPALKLQDKIARITRRIQQSNRFGEARKNVSHHYDIGNDFYRLFLDESLLYSCAYFEHDGDTLERAQQNKLRLLAAKLNLKAGQSVLDIGSGWGDLALYLAKTADVRVTGVTLSSEQCALSNERAKREGLADRVSFLLKDYRELDQQFDRVVSVGMFEHVGAHHYREFFGKVRDLLSDDGVMVLHAIGKKTPPGYTSPWVRKYIFPGGYTPSLSEVFSVVEESGLWVLDTEILRLHYARTTRFWYERFMANREKAVAMFDERFARMWEFYLLGAEASFLQGGSMVFQMQLAKHQDALPLTRDYIFKHYGDLKKS